MKRLVLAVAAILISKGAMAQQVVPPQASSAIEGHHAFCGAGCTLWSASIQTGAVAGFWMVFNATSAPADGAVTPKYCWAWPANYGGGWAWPAGARMQTGLTMVFSTGADCVTKAESATAFFTVQAQ